MELFRANYQWSQRPDDERFTSVQAMHDMCKAYALQAVEAPVSWSDLRVEAVDADLRLTGRHDVPATVSHWAMGQLCNRAQAPADYVRSLPATLAAQNVNYGLANRSASTKAQLMFHRDNGSLLLRAATGKVYKRYWNYQVCERLLWLEDNGWAPSRPTFNIIVGDPKSDAPDLYASDHDMFAMMVASERVIQDGTDEGLLRGVIVDNSEVGNGSLGLMQFLFRGQCGNHIIWGAQDVLEVRIPHRGDIEGKWRETNAEITRYLDSSADEDEARIQKARVTLIGKTREEVIDSLFGIRKLGLSRKMLEAGYEAVVEQDDGDPRTQWGMVQGLTRHSQTTPHTDKRAAVDRAAGKVMSIDF